MKKNILFWGLSLLTVVATGCSNEEVLNNTGANDPFKTLNVSVENVDLGSRIGFTGAGEFFWSEGDQLAVQTLANKKTESITLFGIQSEAESGPGYRVARFLGAVNVKDELKDVAVYSTYDDASNVKFNGNNMTYTYPAEYTYATVDSKLPKNESSVDEKKAYKNFNPVMAGVIKGEGSSKNLVMKHLGGYMWIKVTNMSIASGKFILTADKKINGEYTIAKSELLGENPQFDVESSVTEADKTVTINFSNASINDNAYFYVPMPAATYGTINVKLVSGTQEYTCPALRNVEVKRGAPTSYVINSFGAK